MAYADVKPGDLLMAIPGKTGQLLNCHRMFETYQEAYYKSSAKRLVAAIPAPTDKLLVLSVHDGIDLADFEPGTFDHNPSRFLKIQNVSDLRHEGWIEIWEEGKDGWIFAEQWNVVARAQE